SRAGRSITCRPGLAALLGQDRNSGCALLEDAPDHLLGAQVPLGHEVARVAFRADIGGRGTREERGGGTRGRARDLEELVVPAHRSRRIATRPAPDGAANVSLLATCLDRVERSTTRNPNFAAKKSLAFAVSR